jgi:hypothetical protein
VKRTLSQRVGLRCSNPDCGADTAGPQADPSKIANIGVAAHITAASPGGCRYDVSMATQERKSVKNGIWLCQNCAKKIDTSAKEYSVKALLVWKESAERDAKYRLGKTRNVSRSTRSRAEANIRHELKMKEDLHRLLLKSVDERRLLPRFPSRTKKFKHGEVIIREVGDRTYPSMEDTGHGISRWFNLELLDFYHDGIIGVIGIEPVLLDTEIRQWAALTHEQSKEHFPSRFRVANVFKTVSIPWRNIRLYDMSGDDYYAQPKLYCHFADNDTPYESYSQYLISDGREDELRSEDRVELSALLAL